MIASVNKTITQDTLLATIQKSSISSKTVNASGQAEFSSNSGYVRILLSDDYGYDLLVYESSPLVAVNGIDNFSNVTMEAFDIPFQLALTKVRVEIKNAVRNIENSLFRGTFSTFFTFSNKMCFYKKNIITFAAIINKRLIKQ